MKIGSFESKPVATQPAERKSAGTAATKPLEPSTHVALSPGATQVDGTGTGTDPTFDTAKVERIAQGIRDGKFTVNPEAIADKLISNAAELLSRKSN